MAESNAVDPFGSSQDVLLKIIHNLRQDEATDISLTEILSKHIVVMDPSTKAVDTAARDIEALASKRGEEVD